MKPVLHKTTKNSGSGASQRWAWREGAVVSDMAAEGGGRDGMKDKSSMPAHPNLRSRKILTHDWYDGRGLIFIVEKYFIRCKNTTKPAGMVRRTKNA